MFSLMLAHVKDEKFSLRKIKTFQGHFRFLVITSVPPWFCFVQFLRKIWLSKRRRAFFSLPVSAARRGGEHRVRVPDGKLTQNVCGKSLTY
jgi:hypothetical protein